MLMRKGALMLLAPIATLAAAAAHAQSAQSNIIVQASVTPACGIANPSQAVTLGEIAVSATGQVAGQVSNQDFGNIWCNATGNSIAIALTALTTPNGSADATFTNVVQFEVTSTNPSFVGLTASSAASTPLVISGLPAFETGTGVFDDYTITTIADPAHRPIAGAYEGAILVTVTPGT